MTRILSIVAFVILTLCLVVALCFREYYRKGKIQRLDNCNMDFSTSTLQGKKNPLLLIGDSRVYSLAYHWSPEFYEVVNFGEPGETTPELLCRFKKGVPRYNELVTVILQAGINDLVTASLLRGPQREHVEKSAAENFIKLANAMARQGHRVIVLTVIPPIDIDPVRRFLWGSDIEKSVQELNQEIQARLAEEISIIDIKPIFWDEPESRWKKDFSLDALHWNEKGYEMIVEELNKAIYN